MTATMDTQAALVAILKADAAVAALVGTRVFGDELPRAETDSMPRKCIVVQHAGGAGPSFTQGTLPLEAPVFNVFCYGETGFQARSVRLAVHGALRGVERRTILDTLIHWVKSAGGAIYGRDPDTDWPVHWSSWQALADERTTA